MISDQVCRIKDFGFRHTESVKIFWGSDTDPITNFRAFACFSGEINKNIFNAVSTDLFISQYLIFYN